MKAVLVIDVEEKDIGRKVNYVNVQGGGLSYIVGTKGEDVRLKPLPQKKEETFAYWIARGCNDPESYINGWNECLDEILGEE